MDFLKNVVCYNVCRAVQDIVNFLGLGLFGRNSGNTAECGRAVVGRWHAAWLAGVDCNVRLIPVDSFVRISLDDVLRASCAAPWRVCQTCPMNRRPCPPCVHTGHFSHGILSHPRCDLVVRCPCRHIYSKWQVTQCVYSTISGWFIQI